MPMSKCTQCRQTNDKQDLITMDRTEIMDSDNSGNTGLRPMTSGSHNYKILSNRPTGSGLMNL